LRDLARRGALAKHLLYAYDDADGLTTVTDAANNVTTYSYDIETMWPASQTPRITPPHLPTIAWARHKNPCSSNLFETYTYDNNSTSPAEPTATAWVQNPCVMGLKSWGGR
jgi:hypothetical protein